MFKQESEVSLATYIQICPGIHIITFNSLLLGWRKTGKLVQIKTKNFIVKYKFNFFFLSESFLKNFADFELKLNIDYKFEKK